MLIIIQTLLQPLIFAKIIFNVPSLIFCRRSHCPCKKSKKGPWLNLSTGQWHENKHQNQNKHGSPSKKTGFYHGLTWTLENEWRKLKKSTNIELEIVSNSCQVFSNISSIIYFSSFDRKRHIYNPGFALQWILMQYFYYCQIQYSTKPHDYYLWLNTKI